MKKPKILQIVILIIVIITLSLEVGAVSSGCSWYCVHRMDHKQPIVDSSIAYVQDYNGFYIDKKHGDESSDKIVYLTFDAGYENGNVARILDVLKEKETKGAFFILENLINSNPELVLRMQREGHLVCNHTAHHKDMSKIINIDTFAEELSALESSYKQLTGCEISHFYRPPEGRFNEENLKSAESLG